MTAFSGATFAFLSDLALRVFAADEVATDPAGFVAAAGDILVRLVPLWRAYLEGL